MKDFRFFKGYIEKEILIISQNEYNRRRDAMAQEEYLRLHYEQMRRLDELLIEQRRLSQKKYEIIPPLWMKIKMLFKKILCIFVEWKLK